MTMTLPMMGLRGPTPWTKEQKKSVCFTTQSEIKLILSKDVECEIDLNTWIDAFVVIRPIELHPCYIEVSLYNKHDLFKTNVLYKNCIEVNNLNIVPFLSRTKEFTYGFIWKQHDQKGRLIMSFPTREKCNLFVKYLDRLIRLLEVSRLEYDILQQYAPHVLKSVPFDKEDSIIDDKIDEMSTEFETIDSTGRPSNVRESLVKNKSEKTLFNESINSDAALRLSDAPSNSDETFVGRRSSDKLTSDAASDNEILLNNSLVLNSPKADNIGHIKNINSQSHDDRKWSNLFDQKWLDVKNVHTLPDRVPKKKPPPLPPRKKISNLTAEQQMNLTAKKMMFRTAKSIPNIVDDTAPNDNTYESIATPNITQSNVGDHTYESICYAGIEPPHWPGKKSNTSLSQFSVSNHYYESIEANKKENDEVLLEYDNQLEMNPSWKSCRSLNPPIEPPLPLDAYLSMHNLSAASVKHRRTTKDKLCRLLKIHSKHKSKKLSIVHLHMEVAASNESIKSNSSQYNSVDDIANSHERPSLSRLSISAPNLAEPRKSVWSKIGNLMDNGKQKLRKNFGLSNSIENTFELFQNQGNDINSTYTSFSSPMLYMHPEEYAIYELGVQTGIFKGPTEIAMNSSSKSSLVDTTNNYSYNDLSDSSWDSGSSLWLLTSSEIAAQQNAKLSRNDSQIPCRSMEFIASENAEVLAIYEPIQIALADETTTTVINDTINPVEPSSMPINSTFETSKSDSFNIANEFCESKQMSFDSEDDASSDKCLASSARKRMSSIFSVNSKRIRNIPRSFGNVCYSFKKKMLTAIR